MRRLVFVSLIILGLISCHPKYLEFLPTDIIRVAEQHSVAITVHYVMTVEEYGRRMQLSNKGLAIEAAVEEPYKCIAYIGAGTILKDNHIITAAHLFSHSDNTLSRQIWVFIRGIDHAIKADVVAMSEMKKTYDDYAVIKMRESPNFPGLPIAKFSIEKGEKVIYTGSTGGLGWFMRFMYSTNLQYFFRVNDDGVLTLSHWEDFPYVTTYPGGPGDSGGNVLVLRRGKLHYGGLMYCGITVYAEQYIFSNPVGMLWDFLKKHNLEYLGQ